MMKHGSTIEENMGANEVEQSNRRIGRKEK
jgi:hypothetical protein